MLAFKGNQIYERYNDRLINFKKIICIIEKPLGTGGALLLAKNLLTNNFLVLNGDTIFDINLNNIIKVKLEKHSMFLFLTNS